MQTLLDLEARKRAGDMMLGDLTELARDYMTLVSLE